MILTRIVTAVLALGALVPLALWLSATQLLLLFLVILALVLWEYAGLMRLTTGPRLGLVAAFSSTAFLLLIDPTVQPIDLAPMLLLPVAAFWLIGMPLALARHRSPTGLPGSLIGLLMVLGCLMGLWLGRSVGLDYLLSIALLTWAADTGAYLVGRRWGRTLLAPSISPKKTWEGVAGGLTANGLLLWASALYWPESWAAGVADSLGLWGMLLLGFWLTGLAVAADLFESLLKRQADVKDSGRLLPGHGGLFDRLDAFLVVMPMAVVVDILI